MVKERNINPKTILPQSVSTSYCAKKSLVHLVKVTF